MKFFGNTVTKTCDVCPYYCDDCSSLSVCNTCNSGYSKVGTTCVGEYFLHTDSTFYVNVPINPTLSATNPTAITIEVWLKLDNITTSNI